jgi:hypothetical protein
MKPVVEFRVVDLHNNRGTLPTGFADSASGVGASQADAIQAALELLANRGWDIDGVILRILAETEWARPASPEGNEKTAYCFVSVYVR